MLQSLAYFLASCKYQFAMFSKILSITALATTGVVAYSGVATFNDYASQSK